MVRQSCKMKEKADKERVEVNNISIRRDSRQKGKSVSAGVLRPAFWRHQLPSGGRGQDWGGAGCRAAGEGQLH